MLLGSEKARVCCHHCGEIQLAALRRIAREVRRFATKVLAPHYQADDKAAEFRRRLAAVQGVEVGQGHAAQEGHADAVQRIADQVQRVTERYGRQHAALVASFSTYRSRGAIRDLGKALGLPFAELEREVLSRDVRIVTIFAGGGTPTLLPLPALLP